MSKLPQLAPTPDDKRVALPPNFDLTKQSVPVPGTKKPGQTAHYRNGGYGMFTLDTPNHLRTMTEAFEVGLKASRDEPMLGHRPLLSTSPLTFAKHYVWETYAQVDARRRAVGSAVYKLFRDGTLGGGELETIIDLAMNAYQKVSVSLYDTLGKDSVEYIINHAYLTVVFVGPQHIPTVLKLAPRIPCLKMVVSLDDLSAEAKPLLTSWADSVNIKLTTLRELEALGKENLIEPIPATPDQLATICYTSGTTSNPKGVLLTHGNLAAATQANLYALDIPDKGRMISYLPLAHIYERAMESGVICAGGSIGYFTGDPLRLLEDAQILKPQFMPSVPRVLNRIYQSAMVAGNTPGVKGTLFRKAVAAKLERFRTTGIREHALWDRLVFKKIQAVLGGEIKMLCTGSAPISREVIEHLKIFFAPAAVIEGYGMTENCGTCTRTWPDDTTCSGTIGSPQPCCEIKLLDVPAMNYTSEDKPNPRGEICVRGDNCFKAYYKDEKNTKETVDDEGWIHTGDVGEIDEFGRFKVIDRVKNIMKLAQGEYVALEKVEGLYSASPIVAQLYVHGDSLQSYLVAVVVPDPVQLAVLASKAWSKPVAAEDGAALVEATRDPKVVDAIHKVLSAEAKRNALKGFEQIKRIHVSLDPFTVENGTLTPTLKIRRKDAYAKYKAELDGLYALGEPASRGSKL
ncbi:acetyl-CoA synthetase-like protein [Punctularia strigosozonata HHB-11173 SS5]|uniref:acetyl-CoA synthetase-like protein n=1 Tax=Punctularia strigosozonata (strain HHB-11173) TaxID=741275 RepID=UPI00044168E0|nr:acetyl-CoA synthetase-like protein [Punctularia strigosozonata HHB-11173 SS5]EIN07731.1 acetyl-CoA synthetase-like protein [Punctularia strigosozonata HHB-11173 SS5]